MSDDTSKTGQDRKLISLKENYERRDWAKSFGVSEDELTRAVQAVGNSAEAVRAYLEGKRLPCPPPLYLKVAASLPTAPTSHRTACM